MTIADNLLAIIDTKDAIKTSITNKGVDLTNVPFTDYPLAIDSITTGGGVEEWVRPPDWLPLPSVLPTEQKFVGLFAVFDHEVNDVALLTQGACTVDWGDGVIENFASNTKASHLYNYANIATLSSRGYKQVIIAVTPQAGQNLTYFTLSQTHPVTNKIANSWLEMRMSFPNIGASNLNIGSASKFCMVENIDIVSIGNITSMSNMFSGMSSLQQISYFNTSNVTSISSAFSNCYKLKSIPDFDFSKVTSVDVAFNGCLEIKTIKNTFGALSGNTSSMFNGCVSLQSIPNLNTSAVTNTSNMFNGCASLKAIPNLNTSAVTNISSMFRGCRSLQSIPSLDVSKVTTMESMFYECSGLINVPDLNFASVINNQWFAGGLFDSCHSLTKVGSLQFPKLTTIGPMFKDCHSLQEIGAIDFSAVTDTNLSTAFNAAQSLSKCGISGLKQTFSIANGSLPATELNRIFTNLPVVTGKTITVTGNPGAATCDTTIATSRGWVVSK